MSGLAKNAAWRPAVNAAWWPTVNAGWWAAVNGAWWPAVSAAWRAATTAAWRRPERPGQRFATVSIRSRCAAVRLPVILIETVKRWM